LDFLNYLRLIKFPQFNSDQSIYDLARDIQNEELKFIRDVAAMSPQEIYRYMKICEASAAAARLAYDTVIIANRIPDKTAAEKAENWDIAVAEQKEKQRPKKEKEKLQKDEKRIAKLMKLTGQSKQAILDFMKHSK
jgi:hypothetical protein